MITFQQSPFGKGLQQSEGLNPSGEEFKCCEYEESKSSAHLLIHSNPSLHVSIFSEKNEVYLYAEDFLVEIFVAPRVGYIAEVETE